MNREAEALLIIAKHGTNVSRTIHAVFDNEDLSMNAAVSTLLTIRSDGPQRPTRIAQLTGLTSGGATKLVTRLEERGLVERTRGAEPNDRRAVMVSLTPTGEAFVDKAIEATGPMMAELLTEIAELTERARRSKLVGDSPAIQDTYPEDVAHCYGCGRLNEVGHQIKTRVEGDHTVTTFTPEPFHTAIPGYAYGGIVASIIDCHSTGSAAIFAMQAAGRTIGEGEAPRFLTAHLEVDYVLPTPIAEMRLVGRLIELKGRKAIVETELSVDGTVTARGSAVLVEIPGHLFDPGS